MVDCEIEDVPAKANIEGVAAHRNIIIMEAVELQIYEVDAAMNLGLNVDSDLILTQRCRA